MAPWQQGWTRTQPDLAARPDSVALPSDSSSSLLASAPDWPRLISDWADGDIAAFAEPVTRFNDSAGRPSGKGVASANSSAPCLAPCATLPGS
jgi:hypothetical protein